MSNHYHVVLHINAAVAESWSRYEVFARWTQLFTGPVLVQRYLAGIKLIRVYSCEWMNMQKNTAVVPALRGRYRALRADAE